MDEEPRLELLILQPHQQVSALLLNPLLVRVIGRRAQEYLPRANMDERQAVGHPHTQRRNHVFREEIAGRKRIHVQPDELAPDSLFGPTAARR